MWFRCTHRAGTIWVGIISPCDIGERSAHFHGLHMASLYHSTIQVSLTHQICSWTSKLTCHNRPRGNARARRCRGEAVYERHTCQEWYSRHIGYQWDSRSRTLPTPLVG